MTPTFTPWEFEVGFLPHKVTVYENTQRKLTLYLRWRGKGNWVKRSLQRSLRTNRGAIDPAVMKWAKDQAQEKYAQLVAGLADRGEPTSPLTLKRGLAKAIDAETGKYPVDSPHRREVKRELDRAMQVLGEDVAWQDITRADVRKLWRARIRELHSDEIVGLRGAEITIARFVAVAAWLRDEQLIPAGACVLSKQWRTEVRNDWLQLTDSLAVPDPKRPRHTLEEMRRIMAKAGDVDPRFELALALGAELRVGQVIRARRSDLDLEHQTFTIRGKGNKRGVIVELTTGQTRVVRFHLIDGYLRDLEDECADYPLFPAGQMPGGRSGQPVATVKRHANAKPITRSVLDNWFREAESLAEPKIEHVKGRGAYGLKRAAVDAAKAEGISREGLMAHGGWTDTQMPDRIYADQQAEYARREAKDVRAKIRGEGDE